MQSKNARGVLVAVVAGAALAAAPAVANAEPLTLEPASPTTTTVENAAPVGSLFDTNSVSGLSSNVTSRLACVLQSISQQVDCLNGAG